MLRLNYGHISEFLIVTLNEKRTLTSGYYLFVFTHQTTRDVVNKIYNFSEDESAYPDRFNKFPIDTNPLFDGKPNGFWNYAVYEQVSGTNTDPDGLTEVETGLLKLLAATQFEFEQYGGLTTYKVYTGNDLILPTLDTPVLTPVVIDHTEIDLTWGSITNATNYILERATASDYSDAVEIYSGSDLLFNDTGRTASTIYYYRVKAQADGYTESSYGTANATTDPLPQLAAPASLTPTVISDTEIDLVWAAVTNATNYILERGVQSDYSDAAQIYSGALLLFNDTGLTSGTTYYYRVKAQASLYTDSTYTTANETTEIPSTTSDLTFTTNLNLLNTAQVFTANGGGFGFNHTGIDVISLAANENGRIYCVMTAGDSSDFVFGFKTTNVLGGFAGFALAYNRQSATLELFRFMGGVFYDSLTTIANGKYLGIYRVGPMFKVQQSNDAITWTDVPEFLFALTFSSSVQIWPVCDLHSVSVMYHPKITIYGNGNLGRNVIQDGDSIAAGFFTLPSTFSLTNIGFQTYAAVNVVRDCFYKNVAVSGSDIATRRAALAADVFPLFGQAGNCFDKIIVCINCGVNDLHTLSPAVVYARMLLYINDVLNQDSRACVLVNTVINADPTYVTQADIDGYNALLLATTQTARLKIADTTGEPLLTSVGACNNLTYYQADKVHQKQPGIDLLAAIQYAVALTF